MLDNFVRHRQSFEEIRRIVSIGMNGKHCSAFETADDSADYGGLSLRSRRHLDSLLHEVGVERVFYAGRDFCVGDDKSAASHIALLYSVSGLAVSGSLKEYVYDTMLSEAMLKYEQECRKDSVLETFEVLRVVCTDLDKESEKYSQNVDLFRPIGHSWYLHLQRDN